MSWLKAEAPTNIELMSVTLSTAQPPMSWLKALAFSNIEFMFLALVVSHAQSPMSSLKASAVRDSITEQPAKQPRHVSALMSWSKVEAHARTCQSCPRTRGSNSR